jgi:UDP-N-acetyl-D-mannosaminuronate dehydrogenase
VWETIDVASTVGAADPRRASWFVELADDVDSHMPDYVVRRQILALEKRGQPVRRSRMLPLGAYKRDSGHARKLPHPRRRTAAADGVEV